MEIISQNQNCSFSNPVYIDKNDFSINPVDQTFLDDKIENWNFSEMNCMSTSTSEISSSTNPLFINTITSGDVVNSIFLFFLFLTISVIYIVFRYSGIKIKRQL
ncbi:MAG: hypothetical protein ACTSPH_12275 [Promethearchaeota archaeon]